MKKYLICNGELQESDKIIIPDNATVVYEVLRVIDGKPLFLKEHLDRLSHSLSLVQKDIDLFELALDADIEKLIGKSKQTIGNVLIQMVLESTNLNRVVSFIDHKYPDVCDYKSGVVLGLYNAVRSNPKAKVVNINLREEANKLIRENGYYEVLLVDQNNQIKEGSRSNFWGIKNGVLYTAPLNQVLNGITLLKVIAIAKSMQVDLVFEPIHVDDLCHFDALFITGTSPKVLPVSRVGEYNYNPMNSLLQEIMNRYNQEITTDIKKGIE